MVSDDISSDDWNRDLFSRTPLRIVMREWRPDSTTGEIQMVDALVIDAGVLSSLLPVFTDKALANQFLIKHGMRDGQIVAFEKTSEFKKFVSGLKRDEYDGLIFDPGGELGERVTFYALDQAIGILKHLDTHD